jgi:hypothetical protein
VQTVIQVADREFSEFTIPINGIDPSGFEVELRGPLKRQTSLAHISFVLD